MLVCLLAVCARAEINVTAKPANISTRVFDPQKPPADMPALNPEEAAVTQSKYACDVQVEVMISQVEGEKPKMKVTGVTANVTLDVIMWLPLEASEKIRLHEEGHRKISEIFYRRGEATAKKLAEKYVGREVPITSADSKATQPVIERLAHEYCGEYLGAIEVPSEKAQQRYDKLTDHGRNKVDEQEAIEQAMKE